MNEKVAIIITTYNQDKLVMRNIASIKKLTNYRNYQIFLVDDASEQGIGEKVKEKFPFVEVITNTSNQGFSKANNRGIRHALNSYKPDFFALINDDCEVVSKNWITELIGVARGDNKIGIIASKIIYPDKSLQWVARKGDIHSYSEPGTFAPDPEIEAVQEIPTIVGAFMFIRKEVFTKAGLFDEKFSPFYGEESDLCYRATFCGYRLLYHGGVTFIHHRNQSIGKLSKAAVWRIKKRNAIRLELLNQNVFEIVKYTLIHFGSLFKRDSLHPLLKAKLLALAYGDIIKDFSEILEKRRLRRQ